ncbi:MAG TPA: gamma carbonic anhydrase family protein [Syntrophobacteraceae bacterium]|nr:gamma carbonic anhydrase family protein [Syntrophobacteraceae bacterium]
MVNTLPYRGIFPTLAEDVYVAPGAWVIGDVELGARASVWFNTVIRGDMHYVRIGSDTNVQDNATLHVTSERFPLVIGSRVTIGHRAVVHGCTVGDDCLIGMGAIVMDGAVIGKGSLVAAGALVPPGQVVPPDSLVMGTPARVHKSVDAEERELIRLSVLHYVELAAEYLRPADEERRPKVRGFLR